MESLEHIICRCKVWWRKVFLGGDYHFLDDMMDHQGSSSSYPSSLDKVELNHLQNHGNDPRTPENCKILLRTIMGYHEDYNENLADDDRDNGNMNANSKYHFNVVGPMIFPLNDLSRVVLPHYTSCLVSS